MWIKYDYGIVNTDNARDIIVFGKSSTRFEIMVMFNEDDTTDVAIMDSRDKAYHVLNGIYLAMTKEQQLGIDMEQFVPNSLASMPVPVIEQVVPEPERCNGLSNAANAETLRRQENGHH